MNSNRITKSGLSYNTAEKVTANKIPKSEFLDVSITSEQQGDL